MFLACDAKRLYVLLYLKPSVLLVQQYWEMASLPSWGINLQSSASTGYSVLSGCISIYGVFSKATYVMVLGLVMCACNFALSPLSAHLMISQPSFPHLIPKHEVITPQSQ